VIAIENTRLFNETKEALEQQMATADILRVISQSPTDIQPVLDAVAESAARLCESLDSAVYRRDGDRLVLVAHHGLVPVGLVGEFSVPVIRGTVNGRAVLEGRTVHVADLQTRTDEFPEGSVLARGEGFHWKDGQSYVGATPARAHLSVPLMRKGVAIGTINLRRSEAQLFSERQVALLQTFADQAVIAIENVRLFKELEARNAALTESLEQQTATSEILRVISSSPTDLDPVLDAVARNAARLCEADDVAILRAEDDGHTLLFSLGPDAALRGQRYTERRTVTARAIRECRTIHVSDVSTDPEYDARQRAAGYNWHTALAVPLIREGTAIGTITARRLEVRPFTDAQVALLQTFADQAVIAIGHVRLF